MDIDQIATPLDSAVLDSKEQYTFYYNIVCHALKELERKFEKEDICNDIETVFFRQYCDLLVYSLNAMRLKYMYDEEENMKIDLTESGFPNYLEFRYLLNDLNLKNEYAEKLPAISEIKKQFLYRLMREKKPVKKEHLNQATSVLYYLTTEEKYIFKRFIQGKIVETPNEPSQFMVSWSFYDISYNRPFICYLYFNYDGKRIEDYKKEIYQVLESSADRSMDLDSMTYAIDKKLPKVLPQKIKRIDLGPLHNIFAKDENEITHAILEGITNKEIDLSSLVITLNIDIVNTTGAHREGGFLNRQYLQIWSGVNKEKYLFTSHRTMQLLYDKIPSRMDELTKLPFEIAEINKEVISQKLN